MVQLKKLLYFISLIIVIGIGFISCEKEKDDPRDQYLGTWNYSVYGAATRYLLGYVYDTDVIAQGNGTYIVSKSGKNDLIIDGDVYFLNGNKLTAPNRKENFHTGEFLVTGTSTWSGQVNNNMITINSAITGTWSNSILSGDFSGHVVITLTR